jgi:hypothetical protein
VENNKTRDFFWPSYVDLMTSLFVIVLVLFVLSYYNFNQKKKELEVNAEKFKRIQQIDSALAKLDRRYFSYDPKNKRHKLKVDVNFMKNSEDINDLSQEAKIELKKAGTALFSQLTDLIKKNRDVNYLLVIEGNTQRSMVGKEWNYISNPNLGYEFSYKRAIALVDFWKESGIDFRSFDNCELMIAGSGYFGKSRENDENKNRRFTIQITPKISTN